MNRHDWRDYLMDPGESLPVSRCGTPPRERRSQAPGLSQEAFMQAFMAQFAAMSAAAAQVISITCYYLFVIISIFKTIE